MAAAAEAATGLMKGSITEKRDDAAAVVLDYYALCGSSPLLPSRHGQTRLMKNRESFSMMMDTPAGAAV